MRFEDLRIKDNQLQVLRRLGLNGHMPVAKSSWPLALCEATVDAGQGRMTLSRVAMAGPFAAAMRKGGTFLTIMTPSGEPIIREVGKRGERDARAFAAAINSVR